MRETAKIFCIGALALLVFAISGCGGGDSTPPPPPPPSIASQPANQTVTAGLTATFTVMASNASSYQWYEDNTAIPSATSASHTTSVTTASMNGHAFKVVVTGPGGSVTSANATLNVQYYSITAHPQDADVADGQTASLTATATGNPSTATYQWQRVNPGSSIYADMASATNASYTPPSLSYATDNAAKIRRKDVHATGTYFTNAATITISAVTPTIVSEPQDRNVQVGQPTNFALTYNGTIGTVQWYRKPVGGAAAAITGATDTTFTYTPLDVAETGTEYYATVTNAKGSATTRHAVLTVTPIPVAPHFTVQPQDQTGHISQTVTFTATASGVPAPTYSWKKNGTLVNGETTSALSVLVNNLLQNNDQYICVVNNGVGGDVNSNAATLHALPAPVAPWFTTSASNQTVTVGGTAYFAWVAGGNPTPTGIIQEYIGSTWTTIRTGFGLGLMNVQMSDAGRKFRCIASNHLGDVISPASVIIVVNVDIIKFYPTGCLIGGGATITIEGTNIAGTTRVIFWSPYGGISSEKISIINNSKITAVVPSAAATGPIRVGIGPIEYYSSEKFYVAPPPDISSMDPSRGYSTTIIGKYFSSTSSVVFVGKQCVFKIVDDNHLTVDIPYGIPDGTSAYLIVYTGSGSASPDGPFHVGI